MNVLSEEPQGGQKKLVEFARTLPMSTYVGISFKGLSRNMLTILIQIVAFIIGDLEYIETTAFRIPIRVYTTPGLASTGQFALDLAAKTLKFYEESFGFPFPLPKLDMVA